MIESLTALQIIGIAVAIAAVSTAVIIYALCRLSGQLSEEERAWRARDCCPWARLHGAAPEEQYGPGPDNVTRLPVGHDGPWQSPLVRGPEEDGER